MPLLFQFTDEETKAQKDGVTYPEIHVCRVSPRLTPGLMICWDDSQDSACSHIQGYDLLQRKGTKQMSKGKR